MATNKVITALIVLVLLGIIGLIVYLAIPKGMETRKKIAYRLTISMHANRRFSDRCPAGCYHNCPS